jgi:hypothetical protein
MEALGIRADQVHDARPHGGVVDLAGEDADAHDTSAAILIDVKSRQLLKGTYVRLRPLEAGYDPGDWKSLLERQLRAAYTTLTKDAILAVRGVKGEEFKFLVDKFVPQADGICVVDTDLEVDIEALNEEQARETLRQIAAKTEKARATADGSSSGHQIDVWKAVEGQVLEGDYVDYDLPAWDKSRPVSIELSGLRDGQEVDLFVSPRSSRQRALPRDSEHVFGDLSSPKGGTKSIVIQPTNVELEGAASLLISVHGYSQPGKDAADLVPRRYTLRARPADLPGSPAATGDEGETEPHSAGEQQCQNCLQWVPRQTMILHENFCLRNNVVCPRCRNVFQKKSAEWTNHWHCDTHPDAYGSTSTSRAKHEHVQHMQHTCPWCGPDSPFAFPSLPELARHRSTMCPGKLILCQFCHLEVPQEGDPLDPSSEAEMVLTGLTAHERADGARTTDCHLCGAIVRLRDMQAHLRHHELDKATRSKPEICRNELCGRTLHGVGSRGQVGSGTRMGQGPGNDLGLCSLCFSPLYVSMYDPEGKALRRRIERRYLTQLISGCGKKHCANKWCKTGRANLALEPMGAGAAAALPVIKPLVESAADKAEPMHFCVDEATQKRGKMAELLVLEGVWDLEWCVAALEAEGGDLGRARGWLEDWAPVKPRQ